MGGDWGALILHDMATIYPDRVLAAHSTSCSEMSKVTHLKNLISSTFPSMFASPEIAKHIIPWFEFFSFIVREMGYAHIQATKPDTVGVGLTHSPLGLASYILEKFSTWTNRTWISREDGGIQENFTLDELLDNVMVYWVTGSITSSQRIYAEVMNPERRKPNLDGIPTDVPFDFYFMPGDLLVVAEYAIRDKFTNIKRFSVAPRGGNFAAFEAPDILAEDALSFFSNF